jgi:hypothetical protein
MISDKNYFFTQTSFTMTPACAYDERINAMINNRIDFDLNDNDQKLQSYQINHLNRKAERIEQLKSNYLRKSNHRVCNEQVRNRRFNRLPMTNAAAANCENKRRRKRVKSTKNNLQTNNEPAKKKLVKKYKLKYQDAAFKRYVEKIGLLNPLQQNDKFVSKSLGFANSNAIEQNDSKATYFDYRNPKAFIQLSYLFDI